MSTITRGLGTLIAGFVMAPANADTLYSGTWDVSSQAAGTLVLRISGERVTGALVDAQKKRKGHMEGTFTGKRFKVMMHLPNGVAWEFQGNITHDDKEAHMDGLQYVDDKPVGNIRFTVNTTVIAGR